MKNALRKSAYREIKGTLSRFLSIFGIVAIGVSFFSGVKAAAPDMRLSADAYYDSGELMDFRLVSTYGFNDNDIDALRAVEGARVFPSYYTDVLAVMDGGSPLAARVFSADVLSAVNKPDLLEGHFPEKPDECLAVGTGMKNTIPLGAKVTFTDSSGAEPSDMLSVYSYTVAGIVHTPMYIDKSGFGSTNVGNGSISSVYYVPEENFCVEYNTEVYLRFPELDGLSCYSDDYKDSRDALKKRLENVAEARESERFDEITDEANEKLADGERKLADAQKEADEKISDGEKELADAKEKLEDAKQEIADGEKEIADGEKELEDAREKIDDGYSELEQSRKDYDEQIADAQQKLDDAAREIAENEEKLADGEKEFADGLAVYEENYEKYLDGLAQYEDGRKQYEDGLAQYLDGEKQYEDGKAQYEDGKAQYDEGLKQYNDGLAAYEAGLSEWNTSKEALDEGKAQYEAGKTQYDENERLLAGAKEQLDQALAQLEMLKAMAGESDPRYIAGKAEYDRNYAEYEASYQQLAAAGAALAETKAQLDAGEEQLSEGKTALDEAKAQLDASKPALEENGALLESTAKELEDARKTLDGSKAELEKAKAELDDARAELDDAKTQLDDAKAEIDSAREELDDGARQLADGKQQYEDGVKELADKKREAEQKFADAEQELADAQVKYDDGVKELADAKKKLEDGKADYEQGLIDYADGERELEDGRAEADEKIADARVELDDAKQKIADLEKPKWYVFTRDDNTGYAEYGENSDRINNIASVFPVFFILVAMLVCLTTMTRMVDEQRVQIGTLKALGYSDGKIIFKYIFYAAAATAAGSVFGAAVGMKLFPFVIITAYGMLYSLPTLEMPIDLLTAGVSIAVSLLAISATVFFACRSSLAEQSAQLMRPKPPKNGKRILLEHIGFIWKRFNFSSKVTARNLFRYKRKMFMSVVGIAGCTALLLTGFALYDSINDVIIKQYGELQSYDGFAVYDEKKYPESDDKAAELIAGLSADSGSVNVYQKQMDVDKGGKTVSAYVAVPRQAEIFTDFLNLRSRQTMEKYELTDGTVYMDEKLTLLLDAKAGDVLTISESDTKKVQVTLTAAFENYPYHYVYMTENTYVSLFGEKPEYNTLYFRHGMTEDDEDSIAERILEIDGIMAITFSSDIKETFGQMLKALDFVIIVIIASAGALAFVVMYNLTNINITERIREIATLKVLGFYDMEVDTYIFRENILLTLLGTGAGLVLGVFLANFIIRTAEIDFVMFGRSIYPMSFVLAALLTLAFSVLVTLVMHRKLKDVNMIEALKSVE